MKRALNLFAGLGGNRYWWKDYFDEVVAVEINEKIVKGYKQLFPKDKIIIADVYEFITKEDLSKYVFIWASPPCVSHTTINRIARYKKYPIPDFTGLYGIIWYLSRNFQGLWIVENVRPYYQPLIPPTFTIGRHYFWSNFYLPLNVKIPKKFGILKGQWREIIKMKGLPDEFIKILENIKGVYKKQIANDLVDAYTGKVIFSLIQTAVEFVYGNRSIY